MKFDKGYVQKRIVEYNSQMNGLSYEIHQLTQQINIKNMQLNELGFKIKELNSILSEIQDD